MMHIYRLRRGSTLGEVIDALEPLVLNEDLMDCAEVIHMIINGGETPMTWDDVWTRFDAH